MIAAQIATLAALGLGGVIAETRARGELRETINSVLNVDTILKKTRPDDRFDAVESTYNYIAGKLKKEPVFDDDDFKSVAGDEEEFKDLPEISPKDHTLAQTPMTAFESACNFACNGLSAEKGLSATHIIGKPIIAAFQGGVCVFGSGNCVTIEKTTKMSSYAIIRNRVFIRLHGGIVNICGSDNRVFVRGSCIHIKVNGSRNKIKAKGIKNSILVNYGEENTIKEYGKKTTIKTGTFAEKTVIVSRGCRARIGLDGSNGTTTVKHPGSEIYVNGTYNVINATGPAHKVLLNGEHNKVNFLSPRDTATKITDCGSFCEVRYIAQTDADTKLFGGRLDIGEAESVTVVSDMAIFVTTQENSAKASITLGGVGAGAEISGSFHSITFLEEKGDLKTNADVQGCLAFFSKGRNTANISGSVSVLVFYDGYNKIFISEEASWNLFGIDGTKSCIRINGNNNILAVNEGNRIVDSGTGNIIGDLGGINRLIREKEDEESRGIRH
ncbi:MAG: uncharacterized protein A8A55_0710 [Amphiamblys sp. WSBS2006]|nr:MAG: uncharacterized protein A8A55_0710 [Amphiamblys sp. WSBS2006]